jgi:uncharacterized protein YgbK (DUF1537 family)
VVVAPQQDVRRLDVAVDEPGRVGGVERRTDLRDHARRGLGRERPVAPHALAQVVAGLAGEDLFDALVLTGGDTAVRVSGALGATGIFLEGEIDTGVPVGTLVGPRPYRVVTKAGGFGGPDALRVAFRTLVEPRENGEA